MAIHHAPDGLQNPRESKAFAIENPAGKWSITAVQIGNNFAHTLRGSDAGLEVQGRLSLRGGPRDAETAAELARFFQSLAGELAARPAPPEIEEAKGPPAAWMGKAFD